MSLKLDFSKEDLIESFRQDKEAFIPIVVLLVAGLLFIVFIVPNILSFPSKKNARDTEIAKLNEMKQAKEILNSINKEQLDSEVALVTQALPSEKNFELILGAINEAATRSNVLISGYRFTDTSASPDAAGPKFPSLVFEIEIAGGIDQAANFAQELYKTYPVSSIKSIGYSDGISTLSVEFFYKPFTSLDTESGAIARPKTAKETATLSEISQWNEVNTELNFDTFEPSTESGETNPF
jgi:Tfp pilus assembly protein PilO